MKNTTPNSTPSHPSCLSNDQIYVLASAICRSFLHVPSVYDIGSLTIHGGHFEPRLGRPVLKTWVQSDEHWVLPRAVQGTYYGNGPDSFGPLDVGGTHYTDAKPHHTTGDYTEEVICVLLPEAFRDLQGIPANRFFATWLAGRHGSLTYHFSGDDRLVYLPCSKLKNATESLASFAACHGQIANFNLLRQQTAMEALRAGGSLALYDTMGPGAGEN